MNRPRKRVSHGREISYIIGLLVFLIVGLISYFGPRGSLEVKRARKELEEQRARVEALRKETQDRMQSIRSLRDDPKTLEEYARRKGYGKKGEIVLEMPRGEAPPQPAPDTASKPADNSKRR
jgi:cell division protein FtsB